MSINDICKIIQDEFESIMDTGIEGWKYGGRKLRLF
jgi:hypothetical protein